MSSSRPPDFPRVYEICATCGYDHDYDLPRLDWDTRQEVLVAHLRVDKRVPSQLMPGRSNDER